MNLFLLKFIFFGFIIVVEIETKCLTLSGKSGYCISLRNCKGILRIVKQKPLSLINRKNFELVRCGSDNNGPKVCCNKPQKNEESNSNDQLLDSCLTFWETRGSCKNIENCPKVLNFLTEKNSVDDIRKLLGRSECKSGELGPQVCCEIDKKPFDNEKNLNNFFGDGHYCKTPHGDSGVCKNIYECEEMRLLTLDEKKRLINDDHCGFEENIPKVCCKLNGSRSNSKSIEDNNLINHRNLRLLEHELCGPIKSVSRIYGGTDASSEEFPWMALLKYVEKIKGKITFGFYCDASLINKKYVLTAAHCITQLSPGKELYNVRIGEFDITTTIDCDSDDLCVEKYQDFGIENTRIHPEYIPETHENDIALIRLRGKVNMSSKNVRPICLPLSKTDSNLKNFIVTGWGKTETGPISKKLQKAHLPFVEGKDCEAAYRNFFSKSLEIPSKRICAGGIEGIDSCIGDSGGPLQAIGIYKNSTRFVQYGIVSLGSRFCGTKGLPGVYIRVADFVKWILDNMKE